MAVPFYPAHHVWLSRKITRSTKRQKSQLKRRSKHQNQTWKACRNYQTRNLKQLGWLCWEFSWIEKTDTRTDGPCKQRDGSPKKEPERSARDQRHYSRNEECLWWAYRQTSFYCTLLYWVSQTLGCSFFFFFKQIEATLLHRTSLSAPFFQQHLLPLCFSVIYG